MGNILDLVLVNDPLIMHECKVTEPLGSSDHEIVDFSLVLPHSSGSEEPRSSHHEYVYDFEKTDYTSFNRYMNCISWSDIFTDYVDVNDLWNRLSSVLNTGIEYFTPIKKINQLSRKHGKIYPLFIRQLMRKKRSIWRLYKQNRTENLKAKYDKIKKKCMNAVYAFVKQREDRIVDSGNLGMLYKYVNGKLTCKSGIGILKKADGSLIHEDQPKADFLNSYFSSVFVQDDEKKCHLSRRTNAQLTDISFTPDVVKKHLKKLKTFTSPGPDGVPARLLKELASTISFPLSYLFSESFRKAKIPDIWRAAIVSPIFKKGLASEVGNYRPVSLTCIICKVMESIIRDVLLSFLLNENLITKHQHGFLKRHSTCSQLLECVNDWTITLNARNTADVIYLDFNKAFDSVVHTKLMTKLLSYGISGNLHDWLRDFLANRTQTVRVGKEYSSYVNVTSGVLQGSVLGSILFLLYINDIIDVFGGKLFVKLYADDVKIYAEINDLNDASDIQLGLNNLQKWCDQWQMSLSVKKCFVLRIGNYGHLPSNYSIEGTVLPFSDMVNDLGVSVDSKLRFSSHYHQMVAKAYQRSSMILRCFVSREPKLLYRAFTSYIRPILEYCSPVWSPIYKTDIRLIESVQRSFTRKLSGFVHIPYEERLRILGAESLELRRLKNDLVTMYKIAYGFLDVSTDLFVFRNDSSTRGGIMKILKPQSTNNVRAHSFACRNVNAWNSLPEHVRCATSVGVFRKLLKTCKLQPFLIVHV